MNKNKEDCITNKYSTTNPNSKHLNVERKHDELDHNELNEINAGTVTVKVPKISGTDFASKG